MEIKMTKGRIVELNNNYGIISTNDYNVENEWIPFTIDKSMLVEKDEKQYIKYTEDVEFTLSQNQGIRNRDIKEARDINFIGEKWKYKERVIENSIFQIIRNRLSKYNFIYPKIDDKMFSDWLQYNNFHPRMLEYLNIGIFSTKEMIQEGFKGNINLDDYRTKFDIELLNAIDRIDIEFRKKILAWIINVENAYKTFFMMISISVNGKDVGANVINRWVSSKRDIEKKIKRARNKRLYRNISDEFDYVMGENSVPLFDFMEQLDLIELPELINIFYDIYSEEGCIPEILERMKECKGFIADLCALRNASAHGRCILPLFMDPDYNGNWDLEFDNIDNRSKVERWILFDLLKEKWEKRGLGDCSKEIINTLYVNPIRKAWIELNYLYFYIIKEVEKNSFDLFVDEAEFFFSREDNLRQQISSVNLLCLRLTDMGDTTLGITPPPYQEIVSEAQEVWELFNE